ncbi:Intraflagellar transport protein 88-like [Hondaea fermentalgiana]|uniref:Intraflagellar transport protein 88-like n=1 Tax=Hondaea fermentalgiana TaxID=2315210 RepID=A0A2R5GDK9_9STRA|nr:Intraflagellar transport protein 88-like [Hondaea fermentalgiana]|eukprot:GBG29037.1 Intraflagellar transport protein 88-like [Hondaea fermentalgiana]
MYSGEPSAGRRGRLMEDEDEQDDLYDGFDDDNDAFGSALAGTMNSTGRNAFHMPPPTSLGRGPPGTQMGSRLMTSQQQSGGDARPMTAVNGAGYSSGGGSRGTTAYGGGGSSFDPLNQGNRGPAPALAAKSDSSPEERAKDLEKTVNRLLEQSAEASVKKQLMAALERAKEAAKRERSLCKFREQNGLGDQQNLELTYAVSSNLANVYALNNMDNEAINTYSLIVKNKQYPQAGRLRVNMGNVYFKQRDFPKAIRMYRMALDQIPNTAKEVRFKIMRNIAIAFIKTGQFQEAIQNLEAVMDGAPDLQSGFNMVVCQFALGDADQMRKAFTRLVDVPIPGKSEDDEDDDEHGRGGAGSGSSDDDADMLNGGVGGGADGENDESKGNEMLGGSSNGGLGMASALGGDGLRGGEGKDGDEDGSGGGGDGNGNGDGKASASKYVDALKEEVRARSKRARAFILDAARLIAPVIESKSWVAGYEWVIETLRDSAHAQIASEVEIAKAIEFLKRKHFDKAIEVLKAFEKKDQHLKAKAATNLSFLYFLEGELASADKYANLAVRHDRYNAKALVNKGNCLFVKGEHERAREMYLEAIGVEADCSEAIYNLGLVNKRMGHLEESLQAFEKLHSIVPNSPEVIFQIASLHDQLLDFRAASKWFNILISRTPTDPHVLSRMGQIFNKNDDETQALHFHHESYRYFPVNLDVISWLGVWYVKSELYEKAIEFFQRASQIQPTEVKWRLMVTSCYRRMGAYQKALDLYEEIHREYPTNVECLRYLVALCKDMGMPYDEYQTQLAKLERTSGAVTGMMGLTRVQQQQHVAPSHGQLTRAAGVASAGPASGEMARKKARAKKPVPALAEEDRAEEEKSLGDDIDAQQRTIAHSVGDRGPVIKAKRAEDEDDWADADLDDLLAE